MMLIIIFNALNFQVLNTLVFVVLTCNCVAYSYTIRNKYRRMPVDRSSQGLAQVMSEKNGKVVPVTNVASAKQSSEPAGIPLPTLSSAAKNVVLGIRNDLSNLGGTVIGGFQGLTGLKLKKKPGLPGLDSLIPGLCSEVEYVYSLNYYLAQLIHFLFSISNSQKG